MSMLFALLLSAAAPGVTQPGSPATDPAIIVNGVRLGDVRAQLDACIARHCPPLDDMAATLRYADALFLEGRYNEARAVLRASIGRNRAFASRYPVAVAGLYRANARMAMHEGDGEDVRLSTFAVERSLRAGLPETDPRLLGAKLETAEMRAALADGGTVDPSAVSGLSRYSEAMRAFREVARAARRIDRPDLAALADLRRAMLARRLGMSDARRQLEDVARLTGPRTRTQQLAARVILAGIDRDAGDPSALDRLVDELAATGMRNPVLLYAPPIEARDSVAGGVNQNWQGQGAALAVRNVDQYRSTESFNYWSEIAFSINPQGHVVDVEIVRAHGPREWAQPVLRSIAGRIYSRPGAGAPVQHVERYRYTSLQGVNTASRIAVHSPQGRIEMIDITEDAGPAAEPQAPRG